MWEGNKKAISVGGGKGGIGKSCFAANCGISLALRGKRVVLVDTDIGAANLHTFVGVNYPRRTIDDYLATADGNIRDILLETPIPGLRLISSAGSASSLSGLKYLQRQRLNRAVMQLDTDVVIFDVAAGTNVRVIDYFSLAPSMVIIIEPIPTSLENAYLFLKNLMYRHLFRIFYTDKSSSKLIQDLLGDKQEQTGQSFDKLLLTLEQRSPKQTAQFRSFMDSLNQVFLVMNKVRVDEQLAIIDRFARVVKRYLMLNLRCGGSLPFEQDIDASIVARTPFIMQHPDGEYARRMKDISENILLEE
jgi:flagellar biosynthesis protein FlhG